MFNHASDPWSLDPNTLKFIINRLTPGHTQGKEKEMKEGCRLGHAETKKKKKGKEKEISNDGIV